MTAFCTRWENWAGFSKRGVVADRGRMRPLLPGGVRLPGCIRCPWRIGTRAAGLPAAATSSCCERGMREGAFHQAAKAQHVQACAAEESP